MKTLWIKIPIILLVLLGSPALGIIISGKDLDLYLEFPPRTQFITKAPFSAFAFGLFLVLFFIFVIPLLIRISKAYSRSIVEPSAGRFPWWGYVGVGTLIGFWLIAWNRFNWSESIQEHTFFPLWLSYILVINALTYHKKGQSLLTHKTFYYLSLFLFSAGFWWFFEYLNRFVQNWNYTGTHYGPLKYFLLASLAFSTVLPAVLGTMEYLLEFPWLKKEFSINLPITIDHPRIIALGGLLLSIFSLVLVGIYPDCLFPFLWVSPLVIIVTLKTLFNEPHLFQLNSLLNQRTVLAAMIAALICGVFWEMWNYRSLIKWQYSIPLVNRYHFFEMPILGYAGYLPFGLECAVIGESVRTFIKKI